MRRLLSLTFILGIFLSIGYFSPVKAQTEPRYAECDLCGYCNGKTVPQSWDECRKCIYADIPFSTTATDSAALAKTNASLLVDETTNNPPTTTKGRYYTQIGCITTELKDFTKPEGAAVLVGSVLNRLIFPTVGGIAFLYLIYGAFVFITSQDNPERVQQGKAMVTGAIIGLIFTLSIVLIVNIIANNILHIPALGK